MMNKKVLILSNECFSEISSNGRTLGNFFIGWDTKNLAQFFIQNGTPDFKYCDNFFKVTDRDALKSLFLKKLGGKVKQEIKENKEVGNQVVSSRNIKKTPLTMLIRNFIWKIGLWKKNGFYDWIKEFNPEVVLLQSGDSPFMYDLAYDVSKRFNAKLVIYNSEGYYFKDFDYFRSKGLAHLFYPIFLKVLKSSLERAYKQSSYVFYLCDELKREYNKVFNEKSGVFYTSSEMLPVIKEEKNKEFIISYCGNLGINRHRSLIEIADAVQEINSNIFINVYGKAPNEQVKKELEECKGIKYHGMVSYEKVQEIMYGSDLLLHTESFDEFYKEDLKFAFSTKIADSLSCGKSFLLYAPKNLACTKYIIENKVAHVATSKDELHNVLFRIINDDEFRKKYIANALAISEKNHRQKNNCLRFQKILKEI